MHILSARFGYLRSCSAQQQYPVQETLDQKDEAGALSAGMSLAEQRAAAEAIRQELGIAENADAIEVDPQSCTGTIVTLSRISGS